MPSKQCGSCGLSWPNAKRICTCGKSLMKRKMVGQKAEKKKPHRSCLACGAQHAPNKKVCTSCGHVMIAAPTTPAERKRGCYNCSACGLKLGSRHKCKKKRTLFLPARQIKNNNLVPNSTGEHTHAQICVHIYIYIMITQKYAPSIYVVHARTQIYMKICMLHIYVKIYVALYILQII